MTDVQEGDAVQILELRRGGHIFRIEGEDGKLDPRLLTGLDDGRGPPIFLHGHRRDDLIRLNTVQDTLQLIIAAQIFEHRDVGPQRHIAHWHISQAPVAADLLIAPSGQLSSAHDHHRLQVEALLPEMAQCQPETDPLSPQHGGIQPKEYAQDHPGEVDLLGEEEDHQHQHQVQHICPEQLTQLFIQPGAPEGLIEPEGGVGKEVEGHHGQGKIAVIRKRDRSDGPGQQAETDPPRDQEQTENGEPI